MGTWRAISARVSEEALSTFCKKRSDEILRKGEGLSYLTVPRAVTLLGLKGFSASSFRLSDAVIFNAVYRRQTTYLLNPRNITYL